MAQCSAAAIKLDVTRLPRAPQRACDESSVEDARR